MPAIFSSPRLSHSILSYFISQLITINDKQNALNILMQLRILKPEFNELYDDYEAKIKIGKNIL
jgi:hypothetical protein